MSSLAPELNARLRATFGRCPVFESDSRLRALFVDARIHAWRDTLPESNSGRATRVAALIDVLFEQRASDGHNALALFCRALAAAVPPADAAHNELLQLAADLEPAPCPEGTAVGSNPFCDRGRINDPARFFDRRRILRELRQALAAGNSISLLGEPEIGKSSLFQVLCATAATWLPGKRVQYIDLQAVLDEQDFCAEVLAGLGCPAGDLRALKRALRQAPLLLFLDEIEKLSQPAFTQNLHDMLRALAQGDNLTLAVSSHRPLMEIFPPSSATSPLHNIFTTKRLGPFSEADARDFLRERLHGTSVTFGAAEQAPLLRQCGGHPARLQRLAYALFEQHLEARR